METKIQGHLSKCQNSITRHSLTKWNSFFLKHTQLLTRFTLQRETMKSRIPILTTLGIYSFFKCLGNYKIRCWVIIANYQHQYYHWDITSKEMNEKWFMIFIELCAASVQKHIKSKLTTMQLLPLFISTINCAIYNVISYKRQVLK